MLFCLLVFGAFLHTVWCHFGSQFDRCAHKNYSKNVRSYLPHFLDDFYSRPHARYHGQQPWYLRSSASEEITMSKAVSETGVSDTPGKETQI